MASLGGFGRGTIDLRCGSLKCMDIQILDAKCNLNIPGTARITDLKVRNSLAAVKITEKTEDEGIVIDKPLVLDPHGIGRAWFDDDVNVFISEGDYSGNIFLDESDWEVSFETIGPPLLKQSDHLIQLPTSYANPCLGNAWTALVEVSASFKIEYAIVETDTFLDVGVNLIKNYGTDNAVVSTADMTLQGLSTYGTIHLNDIVKCVPGDSLDVQIFWTLDNDKGFTLLGGEEITHLEVKVLGFEPL